MRKTILGLALILSTLGLSAQKKDQKYDLYLIQQNKIGGPTVFLSGTFIRNDTLFLETGALSNVISIHSEDSSWNSIFIYPYRKLKANPIPPSGPGLLPHGTLRGSGTQTKGEVLKSKLNKKP